MPATTFVATPLDFEDFASGTYLTDQYRASYGVSFLATPVRAAQEVADMLVAAGVRGILNFAPRKLRVPEGVTLRTVDMTMEFESLSFVLSQSRAKGRKRTSE